MTTSKTVPSRNRETITVTTIGPIEIVLQFNADSHYHLAYFTPEQARKLAATLNAFAEIQS